MEIYSVKEVEQNPVPKSQTKPFYIGTKEAPSAIKNRKMQNVGGLCFFLFFLLIIGTID